MACPRLSAWFTGSILRELKLIPKLRDTCTAATNRPRFRTPAAADGAHGPEVSNRIRVHAMCA